MKYAFLFCYLIFLNVYGQILWNGQGHIPQSSQVEWYNAGLLPNTPTVADNFFDITDTEYGAIPNDGHNDFNAIHQAILAARDTTGLTIIYFPPGTYNINSRIELTYLDSNIVFQGAGSNQTILKFTVGHTTQCFYVHGYRTSTLIHLGTSVQKGSKDLYGNNISSLQAGDWIRLSEYHHGVYSSWAYGSIGQITQLVNIQGNHAIMKDKASKYYSYAKGLRLWKIIPVQNVGIEKLKIYRNDTGHSSNGPNIKFEYGVNCWVKGIESEYTSRHHVDIWYSSHIYVSGCYFHKSRNYGGGGRAYGVVLNFSTTNCLIENNIFRYLRHAMLVQAGANCNVFTYNYSRETHWEVVPPAFSWLVGQAFYKSSDITLHGNYPYANLFEQNNVELIAADNSHGVHGPYNAFIRNIVYSDPSSQWYVISLDNAPHSSVLGNLIWWLDDCPFQTFGSTTSIDADLYGKVVYPSPPYNTYETGLPYTHCSFWLSAWGWEDLVLEDVSYYYSSEPSFLDVPYTNYTWPSCGPPTLAGPYDITQSNPARGRWFNSSIKTYISDPTQLLPQTEGTLVYNQIWPDGHTLTDNVVVPDNIILTIEPGATIYIPNSKSITVNGELKAIGTSSNPITFTKSSSSKWWGIKFESAGSGSELKYCTIEQAYTGVYNISSSPKIWYCTFQNNRSGIYCTYSASNHDIDYNTFNQNTFYNIKLYRHEAEIKYNSIQSSYYGIVCNQCYWLTIPRIYGNNIKNHSSKGIYLNESDPIIVQNNVYDNYDGMYFNGYSLPEFQDHDSEPGHNVIVDNSRYGIYIDDEAEPYMGYYYWGYNNIYDNESYNIYSLQSWEIDATINYWGGGAPSGVYGNVDCEPYLTSNPNPGEPPGMAKLAVNSTDGSSELNSDLEDHYQKARAFEKSRQYNEAIIEYKYVIDNYPDSPEAKSSLAHIRKCYGKLGTLDAFSPLLQEVSTKNTEKEIGAMASFATITELVRSKEIDEALSICEKISNKFSKTTLGRDALFESWMLHLNLTQDLKSAREVIKKYEETYGIDENLIFMKLVMGDITDEEAREMSKQVQDNEFQQQPTPEQAEIAKVPETFELLRNYPNPFNPVTTFPFALPEAAHVRIDIYDAIGRLVTTLTDREYKPGRYKVQFKATGFASGLYFVRAEMVSNVTLLRSYRFTNKIMLLK